MLTEVLTLVDSFFVNVGANINIPTITTPTGIRRPNQRTYQTTNAVDLSLPPLRQSATSRPPATPLTPSPLCSPPAPFLPLPSAPFQAALARLETMFWKRRGGSALSARRQELLAARPSPFRGKRALLIFGCYFFITLLLERTDGNKG